MSDPETANEAEADPVPGSGSGPVYEPATVRDGEPAEPAGEPAAALDARRLYGSRTLYGEETVNGSHTVNGARTVYGSQAVYGSEPPAETAAGAGEDFDERLWPYEDEFSGELETDLDIPATRLVSLSSIGAALKRRKLTWYIAAAVGLLLGSALFVTSKPVYQVTVTVLLTSDSGLDPISQMDTYALQAQSPQLATIMLKKFGLNESPTTFVNSYTVTVVNNQILTIAVSNVSADVATSRAVALTDGFLQFRATSLRDQQNDEFAGQNQQVAQAQQTVDSLTRQLSQASSGSSASGTGTSAKSLKALKAKLTKATASLSALQSTVASSQASERVLTNSMITGSDVLSVSYPALLHSRKTTALEYVGGGAGGGLVLGLAIVAIGAIVSDRPRRRFDIAEAIGAPVRISATAGGAEGKGRFGRKQTPWSAAEMDRIVRYLRSTLASNSRTAATLAVVAVDNATDSALIVTDLIGSCAAEGKRVFVADLSGGVLAAQLGLATPGVHTVTVNEHRVVLAVPEAGDYAPAGPLSPQTSGATVASGIAAAYAGADIMITLAAIDPATGAGHLSTWASDAVAVVTAGASMTERLYTTGEMIRGTGVHLGSAVLLGADRNDQSLGAVS